MRFTSAFMQRFAVTRKSRYAARVAVPEWIPTAVGLLALVVLDAYAILRTLTRQHAIPTAIAWLLAIVAFPGVGAVTYLLLARPSIRRTTRRRRQFGRRLRTGMFAEGVPAGPEGPPLQSQALSIMHLSAAITGHLPTSGNHAELLAEDEQAFGRIEAALASAKRSIWAEYYIINNDETGWRFLDLLAERARAGVEVRLLYDAIGSGSINKPRLEAILKAGGRAEVFLPLNPLRRRWSVHLRNHRKLIVVDGQIGFTGGMNIGDEYSGRGRRKGGKRFRDSHLELIGPAVGSLGATFAEDWTFATGEGLALPPVPEPKPGAKTVVAVVPSGPDQEHNANALVYFSAINSSERRCWLTSPYFIPDEPTEQALCSAALRGVDVRIIVPGRPDVPLVGWVARSFYPRLVHAGVRVFEYMPEMLHGKTLVVDSELSIVGSANVDMRSFRLNFEVGALLYDRQFAAGLEGCFERYLKQTHEVTRRGLSRRKLPEQLYLGTARLLAPLL